MTEYFIGKRTRASFAKETVYGTPAAPASDTYSWLGVVQDVAPSSKSDLIQINGMDDSDSRDVSDYFETLRTYGFTTEFLLQHARPLYFAWGSDTLVTGTPDVHTISGANILPSFTFQVGYNAATPHVLNYAGCMVNKMNISCTKNEFVKCSGEIVAQTSSSDTTFKDYQASNVVMKKYPPIGATPILPYHYSNANININGTNYCEVDEVKMSITNNLLSEPVLCADNSKRIAEPIPQLREYDASATVRMSSDAFYDMWESGTYITDPVITFERSTNDKIVFTLHNAVLESAISPFKISEGIVLVELPFKVTSIGVVESNSLDVQYDAVEV